MGKPRRDRIVRKPPEPKVWTDRDCFAVAYSTICRLLGHENPDKVPADVADKIGRAIHDTKARIRAEVDARDALVRSDLAREGAGN